MTKALSQTAGRPYSKSKIRITTPLTSGMRIACGTDSKRDDEGDIIPDECKYYNQTFIGTTPKEI